MELFERQWTSYRAIVEHDLMEHRAVARATAAALEGWLAARPPAAPAPHLVDLGCGDLALLAPLLRRLPLGSYTGLDQAAGVLPLARLALGPVPYPTHWLEADLLSWATRGSHSGSAPEAPVDILHTAFALHHLPDPQTTRFLGAARRRLSDDGILVWTDVFRWPGETRQAYLERYVQRIRNGWQPLSPDQRQQVIGHVTTCDHPADRAEIRAVAIATGWRWEWAWEGSHGAEATALLTPA